MMLSETLGNAVKKVTTRDIERAGTVEVLVDTLGVCPVRFSTSILQKGDSELTLPGRRQAGRNC